MKCDELDLYLADYLEGDLDAARTDELLAHVERCAACRAEFQAHKQQEDLLVLYYKREAQKVERSRNPLGRTSAASATAEETERGRSGRRPGPARPMRWIAWAAAAVMLLVVGLGGWSLYRHAVPAGHAALATVAAVEGRALIVGPNTPVQSGATIRQAEQIKVARGGYLALRLPDGNMIEAREGTKLSLLDFPDRLEVALNGGQVWAHLNTRPEKAFVVRTAHLAATATGTVYEVEEGLDRSVVLVARGTVRVESGGTQTVVEKSGTFSSRADASEIATRAAVAWSRMPEDLVAIASDNEGVQSHSTRLRVEQAASPRKNASVQTSARTGASELSTTPAADTNDLVAFLPEDMLYILDFHDWQGLVNDFAASDYRAILERPEIRQWWAAVGGAKYLEELQSNARALDIFAIAKQIDGQMVAAVSGEGKFLLLARGGANTPSIQSGLDVLRAEAAKLSAGEKDPVAIFDNHVRMVGGTLVVASDAEMMRDTASRIAENQTTDFAGSPFYRKIMTDVENPRFLVAANLAGQVERWMEKIGSDPERNREITAMVELWGLPSLDYFLVSPSFAGRGMKQAARLAFVDGGRYGMMDWLGEPAPMRGLEFLSPDIHFFGSAIIRNPSRMFLDYLAFLENTRPEADFQRAVDFVARNDDFFKSFGGEITVGVDSPILPIPNIKIAIEVIDEPAFRAGIDKIVAAVQKELDSHERVSLLQTTTHKSRTVYTLAIEGVPFDPSWAFVEDYFIAGPGPQFVRDSIDVHESRASIANDSRMVSLLPNQAETNFSLLVYQDVARSVPEVLKKAAAAGSGGGGTLIPSLDFMQDYRAPGIAYAFARPTCIDVYLSTPTGIDMNLGMAVPMVANWLMPRTSLGLAISKTAEAQVGLEEMRAAVEKFQAANLRLPRDLSELVSPPGLYIDRLPTDPFGLIAGDTLRLVEGPGPDQITIYSIGPDAVDDAGRIEYSITDQYDGPGDIVLRVPPSTTPGAGGSGEGGSSGGVESEASSPAQEASP